MTRTTLAPRVVLLAAVSCCSIVYGEPDSKRPPIAFVNVNVVPMDSERIITYQTVLIEDERIRAIGPADTTPIPEAAVRIDGSGKYLMPGLADMHVHLGYEGDLTLFIANGVTTVRNMWGKPIHLVWRQQIEQEKLLGPTIITTGLIIDGDRPIWRISKVVTSPEEAERVVNEHAE